MAHRAVNVIFTCESRLAVVQDFATVNSDGDDGDGDDGVYPVGMARAEMAV